MKICVAADAPEPIRRAAATVQAAVATQPLLAAMIEGAPAGPVAESKALLAAKPEERAFSHLILVGLTTDPLIAAASQQEARAESGGLYIFGWGHLRGDIGYIESDRNPFLHSETIARAPFETEIVTLTGNTPAGVALAVGAFLKYGLINGVVAAPGWTRPQTTILDRDPLPANFTVPDEIPNAAGDAPLIGLTAGAEDEYRGVLEDTSVEPSQIWRAKYFPKGSWNAPGAAGSFDNYTAGLHRRAYGNTLWMATFASPGEAAAAASKIAGAAGLKKAGIYWSGKQPAFANGTYAGEHGSAGPLRLWQHGSRVLMSTLPAPATDALAAKLTPMP